MAPNTLGSMTYIFPYVRKSCLSDKLKRFNQGQKIATPSLKPDIKASILCIEDNEMYLGLHEAVHEEKGYTVLTATNETEALQVLSEAPVCLVLSDHMLRGTTGTELARRMKEIKRDVPIIVYSGTVSESLRYVDGFIHQNKPVSDFLSLIHDFVKRYRE